MAWNFSLGEFIWYLSWKSKFLKASNSSILLGESDRMILPHGQTYRRIVILQKKIPNMPGKSLEWHLRDILSWKSDVKLRSWPFDSLPRHPNTWEDIIWSPPKKTHWKHQTSGGMTGCLGLWKSQITAGYTEDWWWRWDSWQEKRPWGCLYGTSCRVLRTVKQLVGWLDAFKLLVGL